MNAPAPTAHSSLVGGSTAKRRLACPGSYRLEAALPDPPSSQYAEEGTAMHAVMAEIVQNGWTLADLDAQVAGRQVNGFIMDRARMDECIVPCTRFLDRIDAEHGGIAMRVECKVQFPGIPDAFGTSDIVGRAPDRSIIVDWKFGGGVFVEAEKNAQGMFYARGAMHSYPDMFEQRPDWPVTIYIAQPRFENGFQRWNTTVKELEEFRIALVRAVAEAVGDNPHYEIGDHCDFAKCRAVCPLRGDVARETVEIVVNELPTVRAMTEAEVGNLYADILDFAEIIKPMLREVEAAAHQWMEDGHAVDGWQLSPKRAVRSFTDEGLAQKALIKLGIPRKEMYSEPEFLSPAQMEKVAKKYDLALPDEIGPKNNRMKLIQSISSGTTVAKASSGRPVAATKAEQLKALAARLGRIPT